MPQLLIRNVDEDLKRSIAVEAAKNGRSVQAELLSTLKHKYTPEKGEHHTFVEDLLAAGKVDGPDFVLPDPEQGRDLTFE